MVFLQLVGERYKTAAMAGGIGVGGGTAEEKVLRLLLMAAMITPPAQQTCTVQLVRTRESVAVVRLDMEAAGMMSHPPAPALAALADTEDVPNDPG